MGAYITQYSNYDIGRMFTESWFDSVNGQDIYPFSNTTRVTLGPTLPQTLWVTGNSFPRVKVVRADHWPHIASKVRLGGAAPPFSIHSSVMQRDNFNFNTLSMARYDASSSRVSDTHCHWSPINTGTVSFKSHLWHEHIAFFFVLSSRNTGHVIGQPSIQECLLIIYKIHLQFQKSVVN